MVLHLKTRVTNWDDIQESKVVVGVIPWRFYSLLFAVHNSNVDGYPESSGRSCVTKLSSLFDRSHWQVSTDPAYCCKPLLYLHLIDFKHQLYQGV